MKEREGESGRGERRRGNGKGKRRPDECCLKLYRGSLRTSSVSLYPVQGISRAQCIQSRANLFYLFFKIDSSFQFSCLLLIYLLTILLLVEENVMVTNVNKRKVNNYI